MAASRYNRVLLVMPPYGVTAPVLPPTGLGYLSEFLSRNGVENRIFDFRLGYAMDDFHKAVKAFRPDLVGVSMVTYRHDLANEVISKMNSKGYDVVVGGPHISTFRDKVFREANIDYAVKYEGEYTLLELCQGKDPKHVQGLLYRDGGDVVENEDRPFIQDLDAIPFPRYEKAELEKYMDTVPIISSRGCPFQCIFCTTGSMGKTFRPRTAENVVEEIEYWYNKGRRTFSVLDDNFTFKKERVYRFCDLIEERGLKELEFHSSNGVRADKVDRALLQRMKEIGWSYICFGVETGSPRIMKVIKKGETLETIEEAIKNAVDLGYEVGLFFMIGHPYETEEEVNMTLEFAQRYDVALAKFLNVIPIPGSELFRWVEENDYFVGDWNQKLTYEMHLDDTPFFVTPELPFEKRVELLKKTKRVWKDIIKRHNERKLRRRYGYLGKIANEAMYSDRLYEGLKRAYNENRIAKRAIDLGIRLTGMRVYHF